MTTLDTNDHAAVPPQTDGIPVSHAWRVTVDGEPVTVYEMPTRYGQSYKDGQPLWPYEGKPLRHPMYFACADIAEEA